MSQSSFAIGLFDSGIGGLTILKELQSQLPNEQFIYFGDTARVPYGNKSQETIIRYSIENTLALIEKNIKLLVVACNTASAFALSKLLQLFNLPIIGVIEPSAKKAISITKNQRIAVLGTKGTIRSGVYQQIIHQLLPTATIFPIECPLFVPLVEEQLIEHPATALFIKEYLLPIKNQDIDTALLGCTHYPLLEKIIQKELGPYIQIVNSALSCAEQVKQILINHQLIRNNSPKTHFYYTSDAPYQFKQLGAQLFDLDLTTVELLIPHRLHH